jgi:hypothetical protein
MRYLVFWESIWQKHNTDLKKVVELLKNNKLNKTFGRSGYQIPDSIDLKYPFGQVVVRETDFTEDTCYSIVFYLDTIRTLGSPIIVYTNNLKRINNYKDKPKKRKINPPFPPHLLPLLHPTVDSTF